MIAGPVTIFYSVAGSAVGAGVDHVHYQVDGGGDIMDPPPLDGTFTVTLVPGTHTAPGYLVRGNNSKIDSSDATPLTFAVIPPTDTIPPTVTITSPGAASTVANTVTVTADAQDNVGIARVSGFSSTGRTSV